MKRLLTLCLLSLLPLTGTAGEHLFSMLPRHFPEKMQAMMQPLAEYLQKESGLTIKTVLTENFQDYEKRIQSGEIAIAYSNPLVYARVDGRHEALAMAIEEDGDRFRGIVVTRPDSPLKGLADLRGKNVMIVGKTSTGGYLSQKISLKEVGLDADKDLKLEVAADNKQENVLIAVSIGEVDAGFIRESAFHSADAYIAPNSVKVMAETAWMPNWALSVSRDMPAADKESLRAALLKLAKGDPVLKAIEAQGFRAATDADYADMKGLQ